jgi:RHS repeat-associated protein
MVTGPDPDGVGSLSAPVTSYGYDVGGRLVELTDPNGNATGTPGDGTTSYSYDRAGRLTGIDYSDSTPDVGFGYDEVGNRVEMTDGAGTLSYSYDDLDRLTDVTRGSDSFQYEYDLAGNITSRTYPDATEITYSYDENNRLASLTSSSNTTSYQYDPAGNLTQTTLPSGNGYVETRSYDEAGRLVSVENADGAGTLSAFDATLDPVGNPTEINRSGAVSSTTTYDYDDNDRLTGVCFQSGTCPGGTDPFIRWTYDKVGNRLTETRPTGSTDYSYDAGDRLTETDDGSTATSYTYDDNGRLTAAGTDSYSWNLANQLTSTTVASTTTTYSYDGAGNRLTTTTGSTVTNSQWDTNHALPQLATERDGSGTLLRRYVYGGAGPVSMTTPADTFYYHYDQLASVANLTDSTGDPHWTYSYEPFGAIKTATQDDPTTPANPIQFTGQYNDPDSGLYNLRARQYDTATGRLLSRDPAEEPRTAPHTASYVYAGDRPTVMVDPTGRTYTPADSGSACSGVSSSRSTGVPVADRTTSRCLASAGSRSVNHTRVHNDIVDFTASALRGGLLGRGFVHGPLGNFDVTTSQASNEIFGAKRNCAGDPGPGPGYADLILWRKLQHKAWLWEFKAWGQSVTCAIKQNQDYARLFGLTHRGWTADSGFPLPPYTALYRWGIALVTAAPGGVERYRTFDVDLSNAEKLALGLAAAKLMKDALGNWLGGGCGCPSPGATA